MSLAKKQQSRLLIALGSGNGVLKTGGLLAMKDIPALRKFSPVSARRIGDSIGVDWSEVDLGEFTRGLHVEMEHGSWNKDIDVTGNDMRATAKIALVHLMELPDYYTRLKKMEEEGKKVSLAKSAVAVSDWSAGDYLRALEKDAAFPQRASTAGRVGALLAAAAGVAATHGG